MSETQNVNIENMSQRCQVYHRNRRTRPLSGYGTAKMVEQRNGDLNTIGESGSRLLNNNHCTADKTNLILRDS